MKKLFFWVVLEHLPQHELLSHSNAAHTKRWIKVVFSRISSTMHAFLRLAEALCPKGTLTNTVDFVRDLHLVAFNLPRLKEACGSHSDFNLSHDSLLASP